MADIHQIIQILPFLLSKLFILFLYFHISHHIFFFSIARHVAVVMQNSPMLNK